MTGASACSGRLNSGNGGPSNLDGRAGPVLFLTWPAGLGDLGPATVKAVAGKLTGAGVAVLLPPGPEPLTAPAWGDWMRAGLALLLEADGVAVPRGAGGSRGAAITCRLAHDLAMPVRTVPGWLTHLGQEKFMRRLLAGGEAGD